MHRRKFLRVSRTRPFPASVSIRQPDGIHPQVQTLLQIFARNHRVARLSRHDSALLRATRRGDAQLSFPIAFCQKVVGGSLANSKPLMDPFSILLAPAFRRHFPSTFPAMSR